MFWTGSQGRLHCHTAKLESMRICLSYWSMFNKILTVRRKFLASEAKMIAVHVSGETV
jgi:hypothetical protein